jgi:outer membrane immunogenic protein
MVGSEFLMSSMGRRMKNAKLIVSATLMIGGILSSGVASAADMALKARPVVATVYSWTGFYVGVSGGGIWNDPNLTVDVSGPAGPNSTPAQNAIAHSLGDRSVSWLVGGQAGYNWQMDNKLVLGVEADISGTDLNTAQSITNLTPIIGRGPKDITTFGSQHLDYFGTVRARVGYAGVSNLLMYATGGLAYGGGNATFGVASATGFGAGPIPFNIVARDSSVRVGWTVGAGAEVALASFGPNWSVKGEYLYYDMGRDHLVVSHTLAPPPGFTASTDAEFRGSLIRVGLNYKISPAPLVARY